MSYFHTGIRTIIGAKAFHCPVRDGKEWYHLAMVIGLKGVQVQLCLLEDNSCSHFAAALANLVKRKSFENK